MDAHMAARFGIADLNGGQSWTTDIAAAIGQW